MDVFRFIRLFIFAVMSFLGLQNVWAADLTAASCSYVDVSTAVQTSFAGDTVHVPAGSCTWGSTLNLNKNISLIGAGAGQTILYRSGTQNFMTYQPASPSANGLFRLSGFTFDMSGRGGNAVSLNSGSTLILQTKLRVDHNRFQNIALGSTQDHFIYYAGVRGVVDSNSFGRVFYPFRSPTSPINDGGKSIWNNWLGVVFGAQDNNLYFEDNVFDELTDAGGTIMIDCQEGGRYAFRYNSINLAQSGQPLFDMHGNQGSDFYSCMGGEIYGNNITGAGGTLLDHRGGRAFVFLNNSTSSMGIQVREEFADSISPVSYVGPSAPQYSQRVSGSYYWGNRRGYTGPLTSVYINTSCSWCYENGLQENVHFFQDDLAFNGSSGVGCGPLTSRPSTCAPGVAYWATNQSCTNLTGMVGARPANPINGTLYRCTANNTWDLGASPLPYPHPLRGESSSPPTTPPSSSLTAPQNLRLVSLAFNQVQIAFDSAGSVASGFRISRKTGASGTYALLGTTDSLSYTDSSVQASSSYCYRVEAYDATQFSASSDELCVSTPTAPATGETLFGSLAPASVDNNDGVSYELGMKFTSISAGSIRAIRFYKSPSESGVHTGKIYSASGVLLASVTFLNETASGWQQQSLVMPLAISANTVYAVSVNTGAGYYAATVNGLASQRVSANLRSVVGSNGVYGAAGSMPTNSWGDSNYFRDIVFASSSTGVPALSDSQIPATSITSPLNGSTVTHRTTVMIVANASDDVGVTKVEFYVNGILTCTDASTVYSCAWRVPKRIGRTFRLQVKAYDASGKVGSSPIVTVTSR